MTSDQFPEVNDEIDFKSLFNFFIRNKKSLSYFSSIFFLLFSLFSLTQKKIWEGGFQIVLNKTSDEPGGSLGRLLNSNNSSLASLLGIGTKGTIQNELKTEVGILESPSVLKPVYDFVIKQKKKAGDSVADLKFVNWRKNNVSINQISIK